MTDLEVLKFVFLKYTIMSYLAGFCLFRKKEMESGHFLLFL